MSNPEEFDPDNHEDNAPDLPEFVNPDDLTPGGDGEGCEDCGGCEECMSEEEIERVKTSLGGGIKMACATMQATALMMLAGASIVPKSREGTVAGALAGILSAVTIWSQPEGHTQHLVRLCGVISRLVAQDPNMPAEVKKEMRAYALSTDKVADQIAEMLKK